MALTLTFNQPGIPAGDLDRGRTDILTTDAGGGRAPVVSIDIGDVPPGSVVLVQAIDEPPSSSPLLTQVSDTHWTLEFNASAWGPFRIQATASIGTEVVSSVTRRISVRSPTFHLAYPALSERYDPNAHLVPTVPSVQLTEMNEHSTNRALVDFHREVVQAIDTLSAGGIDSIPDGSITEIKLDPALVAQLVLTDGSHAMVGELDMSGSRIVDLGQPTLPTDAARLADADYTAGAGLLRTDHTLDVVAHADGSIIVGTDSVQVGVLASDAQHGTRGGGTQHATATPSSAGFSSAADKTKLDGIAPGADVTLAALAAAAVPVSVNGQRITNLGAPIAATDAVRAQDLTAAAVVAGAGLVRAGTTLDVVAHADGSIVVAADSVQVGVLATDAQHGTRGGAALHAIVTPTVAGFSSAADKTKLDTIATGADVTIAALAAAAVPVSVNAKRITNLGTPTAATDAATKAYVDAAPPVPHASTHADGGSDEISVAGLSGLLADPQTAGGIKTATTTVAVAAAAAPAADQALMATSSTAAAWRVPPVATTSLPGYLSAADKLKLDGVATSAAAVGSSAASQVTVTTAGPGAAVTAARSDHVHSVATAAPSGLTVGGTQNAGTSTSLVRADHVHAMPALVTTTVDGFMSAADKTRLDGMATSAAAVGSTAASQVTVATAASGAATTAARSDHVHSVATAAPSALTVGAAQNAGTSTSLVRADHVHAMPAAGTPVALTLAGANAPGSAATLALSDHVHALPATAAPAALTVGAASSAGVAVTLPRSDHVHAMPALVTTSVDGFMLAADKSKLDGVEAGAQVTSFARVQTALAAASSAVSINAQRLTSVADPTAAQDAATKAYVDALAQGLDTKASCRLVSTTNMGTLGGAQVIDGIVTQTGDRLLIVGQTTASQNGIYIGSGITWLRAPDADTSAKVTSGMYVFVTEGTANADSGWALITPDPIVLGTTALTFTQVTGAGQITAGAGLTKSGNTLNVVAHADASIVVAADSVQVGLITDAQHGARAGGTTHAAAIAGGASGFMTGADKTKLDASASTAYVDALPIKQACRVVYTLNPAPVGLIVCDGITVSNGDRVLVIGQLSWQANGIYIAGAGAWVRAPDADTSAELPASMLVPVGPEGTTYPNTLWQMRAAAPVNLGTTTFLFTLVSGVLSSTTSPNVTAAAAAVGTGNTVARQDHTHQVTAGSPVALTLAATTADGTSNNLARADHVHALPATAAPAALTVGAASSAGVAVTLNRSDHVHAMPGAATTGAAGFMSAADKTRLDGMATGAAALASTAPLENTGAAAVGVATTAARGDHQHPSAWKAICVAVHESVGFDAAAPPATVDGITIVAGDYILVDGRGAPLAGEDPEPLTGELLGIFLSLGATWLFLETLDRGDVAYVKSTDSLWTYNGSQYVELYAQLSSATPTQVYDRAAHPGVTSTAARSDHVHNIATLAPSTLSVTGTNAIGTSQSLAKADHLHNIATAAPTALTVGGSVNAGSSASLARADHVHAMPNVATTGAAGFMSAADKARVDIGALPYSATVAANTWTVANSGGTKTLPSPAVVGDTVAILVTNASVNIAAGSGNTIIDATASGFSTLTSVPYPAQYTFRCAASGFWFLGDNLASPSSPALPGLMSAADKFKLDAIESGAQVTSFARVQTALNAASSAVGFNSQRIQNVAAPAAGNDVVTSTYLDTQLGTFYSTLARVNQCRLSGQAQNPVMTTDNAAISTLYLLPHTGDVIWLYSSTYSAWRPFRATTASAGIALTGLTAGRPYDVFAYATPGSGPGTVANIELLAWTSTSARATAIVDSGGVWVKSGDITRRYVGTILARTATTISWLRNGYTTTTAKCDIWNIDNRIDASFQWEPAWTGSFPTGTAGVWFLPTAGAKFEFISGLAFDFVNARFTAGVNTGGTGASGFVGISLNGAEQDHAARVITATGEVTPGTAEEFSLPAVGVNTLQYQLFGSTTAVVFYLTDDSGGAGGNPPLYKYGCVARHMY